MNKQFNVAILATGTIAKKMAQTVAYLPQTHPYAVASRSLEKATDFAQTYGFEKAYGSYEEMVSDPKVDLVYIATPHSHHYECAMLCLTHGKNVLCEKAFAMNALEAKEILDYAKAHNLYVGEAIWTRYLPL